MNPPVDSTPEKNSRLLTGLMLILIVYSVVRNILKASQRHFWFDELCTYILANQPNIASLWSALIHAADSHPPPFYLLEKLSSHLISNDHIAFRLPSILGFCLMQWCLFAWLKRRHSAPVAFTASLLPFLTPLYSVYATEARGYALAAAFLCFALVCYQHVPKFWWTVLLGCSLVAAQCSHFYSFIMMTPFFLAEAVFYLKAKVFRWQVWMALLCGYVPLFLFFSILTHVKAYYSYHPWLMHPTLLGSLRTYGWLFGISRGGISDILPMALWCSFAVVALVIAGIFLAKSLNANTQNDPEFHEGALIAGFLLLPVILFVIIRITHGVLLPRYLLSVVFGIALASARGLSLLNKKSVLLVGTLLCASVAILDAEFWFSYYGAYQLGFRQPKPLEQLVRKAGHPDFPVVASDGHDYLETNYYAMPEWRQRLTFLADPSAAIAYNRSDFNDKELLALRDLAPLRVFEYAKFCENHTPFLLYSNPNPDNDPDWFTTRLLADGWTLQKLESDGHSTVFLVQGMKKSP